MDRNVVIAIVDDDELVRASLAGLIRSYGLATDVFASADELLAAGAERFACIISDLQMPGTSGLELRRTLMRQANPVPVIIVTAYPGRVGSEARDCFSILEKPVDSRQLIACIEQVIGQSVG